MGCELESKLFVGTLQNIFDKDGCKNIIKAFRFAKNFSDEKKFCHQLRTANIALELRFDQRTVAACLLHELTEQSPLASVDEKTIEIVKESAKIGDIKRRNIGHLSSESLAKILLASSKDVRGIIVEILSQLDYMRHIKKKKSKAVLTEAKIALEIHSKIAQRLGLVEVSSELQDLAMAIISPKEYKSTKAKMYKKVPNAEDFIKKAKGAIKELLDREGITFAVQGRVKSVYSTYRKCQEEGRSVEEIMDLVGIRVICGSIRECYKAFSAIIDSFELVGRVEDYIVNPKDNKYRSIHLVAKIDGLPVEIQIRTIEMHREAEYGVAAHWRYKKWYQYSGFDAALSLARQLVELQQNLAKDLFDYVKFSITGDFIFVLTPKKDVLLLPKKATVLDFAYSIHTDLGNKFKYGLVNGVKRSGKYRLSSGDTVKIILSKTKTVRPEWLKFVKTQKAKLAIRKEFGIKSNKLKKMVVSPKKIEKIILAKCCTPLPGDDIVAYETKGGEITVHRTDCTILPNLSHKKIFSVRQDLLKRGGYAVRMEAWAFKRADILSDLFREFERNKVKVLKSEIKIDSQNVIRVVFDLSIRDRAHLERVSKVLEKTQNVIYAERI